MNEIKGISIVENASLKNLNTYKLESSCKYLIKEKSILVFILHNHGL